MKIQNATNASSRLMCLLILLVFFTNLVKGHMTYTLESTLIGWFGSQSMLTTTMFERGAGLPVLTTSISTGYPPLDRRFALSGNLEASDGDTSVSVLVRYNPFESSRSIIHDSDTGMQKEQFYIGGKYVWLSFKIDPWGVERYNCSVCDGVISIAQNSPVWNLFTNLSLSGGYLIFNERSLRFDNSLREHRTFDCGIGTTSLCMTPGTFEGTPVTFDFRFNTHKTLVPLPLFNEYVGTKHPSKTKLKNWPDIHMNIGGTDIVIENDQVVAAHFGSANTLTIEAYSGDDVVLGYDALRSLRFTKNIETGRGAVNGIRSNRGYTIFAFLGLLLAVILLVYYRWAAVVFRTNASYFAIMGRLIYVRLIIDFVAIVLPGIAFANPRVWSIVTENTWLFVVLVAFTSYTIFWAIVSTVGLYLDAPERFGWLSTPKQFNDVSAPFRQTMSDLGNLRSLRDVKADFDVDAAALNRDQVRGVVRQSLIRKAAFECCLVLALIIFSIEVRNAEYDGFLISIMATLLVYFLLDNLLLAIFFTEDRPTATWLVFVGSWAFFVAMVSISFAIYVFVPVLRWFFQSVNVYLTITLVLGYAGLVIFTAYTFPATSEPFVRFARPIFENGKKTQ